MIVSFLAPAVGNRILGCFSLPNYTSETLRERVVDVPRHAISFFEDRSSLTLLGKLVQLNGKHDLMGEGLGQFNVLRPISCSIGMSDSDKTSHLSTYQKRDCKKSFCAFSLQIIAPFGFDTRISLQVFANHRACRKKEFLDYSVLFPKRRVLHKWMLRIRRDQSSAVYHRPQNGRVRRFVEQPQTHALRVQEAANGIQHLPNEFFRLWRRCQDIQTLRQRFHLSARYLLGSTQRLFGAFALGDRGNRAKELHQIPAIIAHRMTDRADVPDRTARMNNSVVGFDIRFFPNCAFE